MAIVETESLVLKTYNLAEADRIVVFLTQDHGVVRGVAKGAKRLKSKFGSGLEPFSIVQTTYLQKEVVELVSLRKIEIVRSNFAAASNPEFLQKFSYLADLMITLLPPHDPNETIYRMAKACIETAASRPDLLAPVGVYFELWILRLSGYLPDWSRCDQCRKAFDEEEGASVQPNFHLVCMTCCKSSSRPIDAASRSLVPAAMRLSPSDFGQFADSNANGLKSLSITLRQLISHSIGREISGETSLTLSI